MITEIANPPTTDLDIPNSPDSLTPEWLTAALRSTGTIDGAMVTAIRVEPMSGVIGHTSQMARVRLRYDHPFPHAPASLIAKFPDADPERGEAFIGIYEREVRFYETIAAQINIRTPICYYSGLNVEQYAFILLLEDLAPARPGDQIAGCSLQEAKVVIQSLVELHVPFWERSTLGALTWLESASQEDNIQTHQEQYLERWPMFTEKYGQDLPDWVLEIGEAFGPAIPPIWRQLGQSPATMLHGDYRLDNMLFDTVDSDLTFAVVDWQLVNLGPGPRDVSYFLGFSVEIDMRRAFEMELLQAYHTALMKNGIQDYTFDQCLLDYRRSTFQTLSLSVRVLGGLDFLSGRRAILAATILERLVATLEDHNIKDLLPK